MMVVSRHQGFGSKLSVDFDTNTNGAHGGCQSETMGADGCKALPTAPYDPEDKATGCDYDQAFQINANGTVALWNTRSVHNNVIAYMHHCLQISPQDQSVELAECLPPPDEDTTEEHLYRAPAPDQKWDIVANTDGTVTFKQGTLCVDNNFRVDL